jgi:hypothetical protein
MRSPRRSALSLCLAIVALCAAGCGGSSSSSSTQSTSTAASMTTTSASGTVQPKTAVPPTPALARLRVGTLCTASHQRTYAAHGLTCVHGRLHRVRPVHTTSGGSTHTSTSGSSGGAGIGGSGSSSGGAPVGP